MQKFLFLAFWCLYAGTAHAGLYRSVDSQGKVHYSDSPLAGSDEVEQLKLGATPTPDDSLPYETRRAQRDFPVTLYIAPDCGSPCSSAKSFLDKRGIPYSEQSLDSAEKIESFRKENGVLEVPALTIGTIRLKSFLESRWNKELDFAGYPKTAPYRTRATQPQQ